MMEWLVVGVFERLQ